MPRSLAAILAVALVVGVTLFAWSRRRDAVTVDDLASAPDDPSRAPGGLGAPARVDGDLARAPDRARPKAPVPTSTAPETRTGDIVVTLLPTDGEELPKGLRLDAEPIGFTVPGKRLALAQPDGSWRFSEMSIGRWRVRAFVAGFVGASKDVVVRPDEETPVPIPLERGAIATYRVSLLSGEVPEAVQLELFDARGLRRESTYETPSSTMHATTGSMPSLEPTGRLIGLKPGTYRLRATSPAGESDEKTFEVAVGGTATVELTVRR